MYLATLDLIYRVKLKRISLGYSQAELSFLLGYPKDHIELIEDLSNEKEYMLSNLLSLAYIFNCQPRSLFSECLPPNEYIQVRSEKKILGNRIYYEAWRVNETEAEELLYKLFEDDPSLNCSSRKIEKVEKVMNLIDELFNDGFFDEPKNALEIFHQCQNKIGADILPRFIESALNVYLFIKTFPKLKMMEEGNCFVYRKVEDD